MLAFALKGAADRGERFGERKNIAGYEQIGIFRPDGVPVNTLSSDRYFRDQVGAAEGDSFVGSAAQRDATDDAVLLRNSLRVEKLTELLGFGIRGNGSGEAHSKPQFTSSPNAIPRSRP